MNGFTEAWLSDYQARLAGVAGVAHVKPAAKPIVHAEWRGQETIAKFLDLALPAEAFWTSIDMGPARSKAVGGMRKARGLKAGVPDMVIVYQRTTLWIECKTARGTLSNAQKRVRFALLANGHHYAQARSLEDVIKACAAASIPLRADAPSFGEAT
jgi:hypothetical protein